ncbi:T9SS type A sorting domain-containing protein [Brumimicrobium mesophilum]|uniref:T9SS type A sorting domain-containing protein n=1 Tax=Brumimicrobium mesophilum TaxID=392717 RepID=UPI000D13F3DD|nr:T9SS type A sorting domain-containing protein [Brumimicrobium mesophilum]
MKKQLLLVLSFAMTFFAQSQNETLMYYWHFNNAENELVDVGGDDQFVAPLQADFTVSGLMGEMDYVGTGGYWDVRTYRTDDPVSNLNLQQGEIADDGAVLRLRNPSDAKELIITSATSGYEGIIVNFATVRTGSGAQEQEFHYSTDNGTTWTQVDATYPVNELDVVADWELKTFDLSTVAGLDDNDQVQFKIVAAGVGIENTSGNNRIDNFSISGTPVATQTSDLIYYWHFNNLDASTADVNTIAADFSLMPNFTPNMVYTGSSNRDIDDYDTGSSINLQQGETEGIAARVRNRSEGRSLIFNMSTAGVEDVIFEYVIHRSGSGMLQNVIEYSTDGGATFTQAGLTASTFDIEETYELVSVDFDGIAAVNNNADFQIKITWVGNTDQDNGNNRYDNITLKGTVNGNLSTENISSVKELNLYPNPTTDVFNISSVDRLQNVTIYDVTGQVVYNSNFFNNNMATVSTLNWNKGVYIVKVKTFSNTVSQHRLIKK